MVAKCDHCLVYVYVLVLHVLGVLVVLCCVCASILNALCRYALHVRRLPRREHNYEIASNCKAEPLTEKNCRFTKKHYTDSHLHRNYDETRLLKKTPKQRVNINM